MSMDWDLEKG